MRNLKKTNYALCSPAMLICIFFIIFYSNSAFAKKFPDDLDKARPGKASKDNPLFTEVLKTGIVNPDWIKIDKGLYISPTGKLYTYDPEAGTFRKIGTTSTRTSSNGLSTYTYDSTGRIIRLVTIQKDSSGNITGRIEYAEYRYNSKGQAIEYTTYRYDDKDNILYKSIYSDIKRNHSGSTMSYDRADLYPNGSSRNYSYSYDRDPVTGKITSLSLNRIDRASDGSVAGSYDYEYAYNSSGNVTSYSYIQHNASGEMVLQTTQSGYSYDANGKIASYTKNDSYPDGTSKLYAYSYDRDAVSGNPLSMSYKRIDKTADTVTGSADVGYIYDASGRTAGYSVVNYDASGAETLRTVQSEYEYDANNKITSFNKAYSYPDGSNKVYNYQYTRDPATGNTITMSYIKTDIQNGAIQGSAEANYTYDPSTARISTLQYTTKNTGGVITGGYTANNFQYPENSSGSYYSGYTQTYNAGNSIVYSNMIRDAGGALTSYHYIRYNASGQKTSEGDWVKS